MAHSWLLAAKERIEFWWKSCRPLWKVIGMIWGAFGFFIIVRDNFMPDAMQRKYATMVLVSRIDWKIWLLGLFLIVIIALLEGSYREHKRRTRQINASELQKSESNSARTLPQLAPRDAELVTLPANRPIVVPTKYGEIRSGPEAGHSGISLRNDGEPAYSVSAHNVTLPGLGTIHMDGTPQHLKQGEPELSFPSWRQRGNSSTLGSGLYYFMVEHQLDKITIPVTYRDADFNWYQTDVILFKNQMARSVEGSESGIQIDWKQRAIPEPKPPIADDLAQRIFNLCTELKKFLRDLGPARQDTFRSDMSLEQYTEANRDLFIRSQKMEAMFIRRYRNRVIDIYNEACETGTISDAELEHTLNQKIDHDAMIEKIVERLNSVALEVIKQQQDQP